MKPILLVDGEKKCSKCGFEKILNDFYVDRRHLDGHQSVCKECSCEASKKWQREHRDKFKEYNKQWRIDNSEYNKARLKKWNEENKDHVSEYRELYGSRRTELQKLYYETNKERVLGYGRMWRKENIEKTRAIGRKAARKRLSTVKGRVHNAMACRIREALKGDKSGRSWESLVGYTVGQLRKHLGKQFKNGMTWENYGSYWQIDHKIPVAAFNFNSPGDIDFQRCWALSNLQPLESTTNRSKGAKLDRPFQPALAIAVGW
jgi:hypothetical protein